MQPIDDYIDELPRNLSVPLPTRQEDAILYVMVHNSGTENTMEQDAAFHVRKKSFDSQGRPLGRGWPIWAYDIHVDYDGRRRRGKLRTEVGYHCNYARNRDTLAICVRGNMDNHPPTPEQVDAVVQTVIDENEALGRRLIFIWHRDYRNTSCPGDMMPTDEIIGRVNEHYEVPPVTPDPEPEPIDPPDNDPPEPEPVQPEPIPDGCASVAFILILIAALADYLL